MESIDKELINKYKQDIYELYRQIKELENHIQQIIDTCDHDYGLAIYSPSMDIYDDFQEIPQWTITCSKCGNKLVTNKTRTETIEVPYFEDLK